MIFAAWAVLEQKLRDAHRVNLSLQEYGINVGIVSASDQLNPLMGTGSYSSTSINMKLVH